MPKNDFLNKNNNNIDNNKYTSMFEIFIRVE